MHLWSIDLWQGCQNHSMGDKTVFSTNGAGTTGYLHAKEWSWIPSSHYIQKLTQSDSEI